MTKSVKIIPDGGETMATKRSISQAKYHNKAYTRVNLAFHNTTDAELIDYINKHKAEGKSPTQVFRDLYKAVIK